MRQTSFSKVYVLMGNVTPKVNWRRLICNNLGCPKWIFILQIAILEKLLTRDRLMQWGALDSASCSLRNQVNESHNHLFFECTYSGWIWSKLLQWQGISRGLCTWQEEKKWAITHATGHSIQAKIYGIWLERNSRVFFEGRKQVRQIIQEIHV
ncbi:hypothetical protein MTR67_036567 [Solanum verrucosum]|uniref:Reverse transcriptase zinc-binding domain-containing protein n=2 Tax=Solanum verrucosum TaxID=315347 RepID=A0AAF0UC08_SOLVR|nr:hypothetical protein MTR67_036567 [Solanum verrucosum]